jgi:hypothetical protein
MQKLILFLFLLLFSSATIAGQQSDKNLILEFTSGANAGWWIFNKGMSDIDLGRDQTSLALFVPIQLNVLYRFGQIKIGAGINYSFMKKEDMKNSSSSDLYPISKKFVTLKKIALISEYDIFQSEFYILSPQLKFGWFDINSIHPDNSNFKTKTFWEFGITNEIKFSSINFIIRPVYNHAIINSKLGDTKNREHKFYNIGIMAGMRIFLF